MRFTDNQSLDTASMANLDILAGTDVSSGTDKKFTLANLASWFLGQFNGLSLAGNNQTVKAAIDEMSETKADADGAYDDMMVGTAEQLLSDSYTINRTPYKFRRSPYTDRLSESIVGASVVWNQLADENLETWYKNRINVVTSDRTTTLAVTDDSSRLKSVRISVQTGHKLLLLASNVVVETASESNRPYYGIYEGTSNTYQSRAYFGTDTELIPTIINVADGLTDPRFTIGFNTANGINDKVTFTDLRLIDLTAAFGSTVADALYAMGADGIALFRSWYPPTYSAYSAPTLEHVSGLEAHEMVGFNAWNEEWEVGSYNETTGAKTAGSSTVRCKDLIPVLPNTEYYIKSPWANRIFTYSADGTYITAFTCNKNTTFTTGSDTHFITFRSGSGYTSYTEGDICINISDPNRNGQYKPYSKHSYALDSSLTLRGILKHDATKGIYADGDVYEADGTVTRKYGVVDLGTLNWNYTSSYTYPFFSAGLSGVKYTDTTNVTMICSKYICIPAKKGSEFRTTDYSNSIAPITDQGANNRISVQDSSYTDAASFKTAMSGVYLVYELATPTTEQAEPFTELQICEEGGTEEYITECIPPIGHNTKYYDDLRGKIEGLPADFSTIICDTEPTSKASKNYAVGDYLIYNNTLYKVTTAIAANATLTVGTNITATTIMAEIKALQ